MTWQAPANTWTQRENPAPETVWAPQNTWAPGAVQDPAIHVPAIQVRGVQASEYQAPEIQVPGPQASEYQVPETQFTKEYQAPITTWQPAPTASITTITTSHVPNNPKEESSDKMAGTIAGAVTSVAIVVIFATYLFRCRCCSRRRGSDAEKW